MYRSISHKRRLIPALGLYTISAVPEVVQKFRPNLAVETIGPAIPRNVSVWSDTERPCNECAVDISLADIGFCR